jgi:hypothetical protein
MFYVKLGERQKNLRRESLAFSFLLMLKSGEKERLKWREKMRNVNVGKREMWNDSERLGEKKKSVERERKKKERGRGKHMNGFKRETLNESE